MSAIEQQIHPNGYWLDDYQHYTDLALAAGILNLLAPGDTLADLGCGNGAYVRFFREHGIDAAGYDGNPNTARYPHCQVCDLSSPVNLGIRDWVMSLEVGEHLPPWAEDTFIANLHAHNRLGIVMSWAVPGQGGHGHFNERTNEHVRAMLHGLGYCSDWAAEKILRETARAPWFKKTIMVFRWIQAPRGA